MRFERVCHLHRSLLVITGEQSRVAHILEEIFQDNEPGLLWVSNNDTAAQRENAINYKQASGLLGQEKKLVIFDVYEAIQADALAAVTGLIVGGGCLVLCLPPKSDWHALFSSDFSQRFVRLLNNASFAKSIDIDTSDSSRLIKEYSAALKTTADFELTADQVTVIEQITAMLNTKSRQSLVVVSDRGRGKSTSLGLAGAKLLKERTVKILLTAPRFKACDAVFSALSAMLGGVDVKQAAVRYQQSMFQFMAPDEILRTDVCADILFIDEAASIPLPLLKQLLERFDKTVFVSTVHGYEGTGRGFSVRFSKTLDDSMNSWQRVEMKTPVRWAAADPLENWLFKVLCLDAEISKLEKQVDIESLEITQVTSAELITNEALLRNIFSLLVLAHYRTRPSDLQRMLDDEVVITIAKSSAQVIAVVLSADEGGYDHDISAAIYQGVRRPKGNLLAQTLTYHCGVEDAACAISHRIQRIVVLPELQHMGIGSLLLQHLVNELTSSGADLIGASFGLTAELAGFWKKNEFDLLRIGLKKEQSSGEHAAVYVRAVTQEGADIVEKAQQRFISHLPFLKQRQLKDVDIDHLSLPEAIQSDEFTAVDREDVESFVTYSKAYELSIGGINKFLKQNYSILESELDELSYKLVKAIIENNSDWKAIANELGLSGKKQAQALFKAAVIKLWNNRVDPCGG